MATELSTMRLGLHLLRATLLNFGVDRAAPELLTYDAHARWILARTGDEDARTPPPAVDPLGSYEDARELTLAIVMTALRTAAGVPCEERREVFERVHQFEDDVRAMLYETAMPRRARRRATAARTATAPSARRPGPVSTRPSPTAATAATGGGQR